MRRILGLLMILFGTHLSYGQCTLLASAVPGLTLTHQNTNCFNNSGVAYNPILNLYYGVRAGNSSFPLETWSSTGVPLFNTTAGFDWRGMWWNPTLNQLEGNGYFSAGIWRANLNGSGYAQNTGGVALACGQPDPQSCGDLDYQAYEVLYYFGGSVYRYSRTTGAFIGSYALTGTPVALGNINSTTLMYTGCAGREIALLDYVNKRVYLYNKATGAYNGMSQLPAAAVTTGSFRTSYANNFVWLFNLANYTWYSYQIFSIPLPVELLSFNANHSNGTVLLDWRTSSEINNDYFMVERSADGINFEDLGRVAGNGNTNIELNYSLTDFHPLKGTSYYRLRQVDYDGTSHYSEIVSIAIDEEISIDIYPNPVGDMLFISGEVDQITAVELRNNVGQLIEINTSDKSRIDVSTLTAGVYFLTVFQANQTTVKQVVIN